MSEVDPRVMEQMTRMHHAVTAGTVDVDTIRDALAKLYDLLSGKADEAAAADATDDASSSSPTDEGVESVGDGEEYEQEGDDHTNHSRRGRRGKHR